MQSKILITGATGGVGRAFAVECASRGWDLFLTDLQEERLSLLATGLRNAYGVNVMTYACDLTEAASRGNLFETLRSEGLSFWGLINVAGVEYEGLFRERSREEICTIIRLNIEATLDVTHALLAHTDLSSPFRIITVSSLAAFFPMPLKATYSASKRFLLDFSLALREELRDSGATVTVLCPAGLPTCERSIRGIEAQGWIGQLTTQNIGAVVARTMDHALRGDAVYIPGALPRLLPFLGSLLPPVVLARLIGLRWRMK
ncbi:MAG: SDR family NAD(P)-dependent oxidoreductase [Anaerolineae bacterium]|jgi:short-subunit dehydrogenase|nr:SDR family NAD(P)-dependent oxidoreductase [Anaerolineae bacterium]